MTAEVPEVLTSSTTTVITPYGATEFGVIVIGNPIDGVRFYGPVAYADATDLAEQIVQATDDGDWWIGPLLPAVVPTEEPYVLHYTSADGPGPDATWSVYREQYVNREDNEPIDGSQEWVSRHPSEAAAYAEAKRLQEA